MILSLSVAVIFFLLVIPLFARIGLSFYWEESGLEVRLRYFKFSKTLDFTQEEKEEGADEDAETTEERTGKRLKLEKVPGWIKFAERSLETARKSLGLLNRYGRISELYLVGSYGFDDPYHTGVTFGVFSALVEALKGVLPEARVDIVPDFTGSSLSLRLGATLDIRLGSLVLTLLVTLWYLPKKRVWRLIRNG